MKIQYFAQGCFTVDGNDVAVVFDPTDAFTSSSIDIAFCSDGEQCYTANKKTLTLPGEYEISGVLVKGFSTQNRTNNVFKVDIDGIVLAHMGRLTAVPEKEFFTSLGENIDVLFLSVTEALDSKAVKQIIDAIDPRYVFFGGDEVLRSKMITEMGAKRAEETSFKLTRSQFSDDQSFLVVLPEAS